MDNRHLSDLLVNLVNHKTTARAVEVEIIAMHTDGYAFITAQRDRALEAVERLREALEIIESESNFSDSGHLGRHGMGDVAREALAATEPATVEPEARDDKNQGCWHDASLMQTGNGTPATWPQTGPGTGPKP